MNKTPSNSITVASVVVASPSSDLSSRPVSPASTISQNQQVDQPEDQHPDQGQGMDIDQENANGIDQTPATPPPAAAVDTNNMAMALTSQSVEMVSQPDYSTHHHNNTSAVLIPRARTGFEGGNLDEITLKQLSEDISAYLYDLDFCRAQLDEHDLTPQETRTLQLRTLDLGHQIRHCQHRIEALRVQMRGRPLRAGYGGGLTAASGSSSLVKASNYYPTNTAAATAVNGGSTSTTAAAGNKASGKKIVVVHSLSNNDTPTTATNSNSNGNSNSNNKRALQNDEPASGPWAKRSKAEPHSQSPSYAHSPQNNHNHHNETGNDSFAADESGVFDIDNSNTELTRLGYWKCRLCESPKFLLAGSGRTPAAPCKWPLKDISKMITHFTEMHAEHSPAERCSELGSALAKNRMFLLFSVFFFSTIRKTWSLEVLTRLQADLLSTGSVAPAPKTSATAAALTTALAV